MRAKWGVNRSVHIVASKREFSSGGEKLDRLIHIVSGTCMQLIFDMS